MGQKVRVTTTTRTRKDGNAKGIANRKQTVAKKATAAKKITSSKPK